MANKLSPHNQERKHSFFHENSIKHKMPLKLADLVTNDKLFEKKKNFFLINIFLGNSIPEY